MVRLGLVHTGNDFAPQVVLRIVPRERTEKEIEQNRHPYNFRTVPGTYRPDRPTPVGEIGQCPLDLARELDADPSVPLELVEIPESDFEAVSEAAEADRRAQARGASKEKHLARQERSQEAMDRANAHEAAAGINQ